jgi:hypothetical protein
MRYISDVGVYQLNLVLGMAELIFSLASIYFVYRWGVTLLSVGAEVRSVMIGNPFNKWIGSDDFLVIAASAYLGFKFVLVIVQTGKWELGMEAMRKRLSTARSGGTKRVVDRREPYLVRGPYENRRPFS